MKTQILNFRIQRMNHKKLRINVWQYKYYEYYYIIKPLDRGRKLKGERYAYSNNIFAKNGDQTFSIK